LGQKVISAYSTPPHDHPQKALMFACCTDNKEELDSRRRAALLRTRMSDIFVMTALISGDNFGRIV
jgi:hypothetical protein